MTDHHSTAEPSETAECRESRECRECQELDLAEAVARRERDESRATDCRVLRKRHLAAAHGERP
ncbi:hypothetical protein P8A22_29770 [Streptomyces laculatispora]|uniref:Uncharacterized protein n=1 Tax=Streptomyces laculatispora TaxID=887464 RepID=A0ABY9IJ87_9ACTN|nr:hypothetical protein [Streptomyces laculatispora]WLQ45586.1 hypothetical protein P8A22_29770 [Streptomyces laculatispora]